MKKSKAKVEKKNLKVKDLRLRADGAKNVKGGVNGPCQRPKK